MRYWLLNGRDRLGPFEPAALVRAPGFDQGALVCPEGKRLGDRRNWKQARKLPEIKAALQERSRELEAAEAATSTPAPVVRARAPRDSPPPAIAAVEIIKDAETPAPEVKVRPAGLVFAERLPPWAVSAAFACAGACFVGLLVYAGRQAAPIPPGAPVDAQAPPRPRLEEPRREPPGGDARGSDSGSFSFTDFREILAGVAQDPDLAPLAEEFGFRFSAEAPLWDHYLDFALAARRGERRAAVDFVKGLVRSPEFRGLDGRLSAKPEAEAALRALSSSPALEPFWAQWRSHGAKPSSLGGLSGSLQLLDGCKLTALLASRSPGSAPVR